MATKGISNEYSLPSTNGTQISAAGSNSTLGKDAFLKILITQLQNQDPTQPLDDKEFIAQMAQFSTLEQMQNMNTAMLSLLDSQYQTQLMSYTSFVGKEVKWHEITDELDENGDYIINEGIGVINELKFVNGEAIFVLEDGKEITAGNISSVISDSSSIPKPELPIELPIVKASKLIGQTVQYQSGGEMLTSIIESVSMNNNSIEYILKDGTRLQDGQFELLSE